MNTEIYAVASGNPVLRNTLMLLSGLSGISFIACCAAIMAGISSLNPWMVIGVYLAVLVGVYYFKDSYWGIAFCAALAAILGFSLGPVLSVMLSVNPSVVLTAFILTVISFITLSAYAVYSGRDFSGLSGMLSVGLIVAFVAGLAAMFFNIPLLGLIVSVAFVILSSGVILWQVGEIINGGETNYILATVTLFVSIFNIFSSLLNIIDELFYK